MPSLEFVKFIIEISTPIMTFISVLLVWFTLHEMKVQRNNSYSPLIVFEQRIFSLASTSDTDLGSYPGLIDELITNDSDFELLFSNIGNGVAKNINFLFNTKNYFQWIDYLKKTTNMSYTFIINSGIFGNGKGCYNSLFLGNHQIISFSQDYRFWNQKTLLKKDDEEPFSIKLPPIYFYALRASFDVANIDLMQNIPPIIFSLKYEDVQGHKYKKKIVMVLELGSGVRTDNNGWIQSFRMYMERC